MGRGAQRRLCADFPKRVTSGSPNLAEADLGLSGDETGEVRGLH